MSIWDIIYWTVYTTSVFGLGFYIGRIDGFNRRKK